MQDGEVPPRRGDRRLAPEQLESLTETERKVLTVLARTARIDDVVAELGRSKHTINTQLRNARQKLGMSDSLTAARLYAASDRTQSVVSKPFGMADQPISLPALVLPEQSESAVSTDALELREERATFTFPEAASGSVQPSGVPHHDRYRPFERIILALLAAVLVLACLHYLPALGHAAQAIGNLIDPIHR